MKENYTYLQARIKDCKNIANFLRTENKNKLFTKNYINWWYFKKKAGFSFTILKSNKKIICISTINNSKFYLDNKIKKIGMPQNVVTKKKYRGMGLFVKTFKISEKKSLTNKVSKFITFTNAASTPIFIKKFKYKFGLCPNILVFPIFPYKKKSYKLKKINKIDNNLFRKKKYLLNNSIIKDESYLNWRYEKKRDKNIHILQYKKNNETKSLIIIKFGYKNNIRICYLLDCFGYVDQNLLEELKKYISNNKGFLFLCIENNSLKKLHSNIFFFKIRKKFNFLVKGENNKETNKLSKIKFNITFGDLDFINLI